MSKYIDAEKLKRSIESIGLIPQKQADYNDGRDDVKMMVLDLIDSLQQERPEVDLEKLLKLELPDMAIDDDLGLCICDHFGNHSMTVDDIKEIAHHFYELGLNARKSIWHNVAEETPTKIGSEVIVACRNKNKEDGIWLYDLIQCWEGKWQPRENWETPVKWAYVRDLDNARKED